MYKLTVVSGPNRGTAYVIRDGENVIGRQMGAQIVLPSSKVSKRHCVLVVSNGEIVVNDSGSSNGTFVNGVLSSKKKINPGDRISVGEYVLEVSGPPKVTHGPVSVPALGGGLARVLQFPQTTAAAKIASQNLANQGGLSGLTNPVPMGGSTVPAPPEDMKSKIFKFLDTKIMPPIYRLNLKNEWRAISVGLFTVFVIANVYLSVYPLLDSNRSSIVAESGRRAKVLARQIAESNAPFLANHAESKTDVGLAETAENVRAALLLDMDSRIIAPSARSSQHLVSGAEARLARIAAGLYQNGRETGIVQPVDASGVVIAIEPVKMVGQAGENVVVAMALVSVDTEVATLQMGEIGLIFSKALLFNGFLAILFVAVIYRLTLRPFEVLSEDLDRALKGELGAVTHEYRFSELDTVWTLINSAIQRLPRDGLAKKEETVLNPDEFIKPIEAAFEGHSKTGLCFFDYEKKVIRLNAAFEEASSIRSDSVVGQTISYGSRDQAFVAFLDDLFSKSGMTGESATETYDFSGTPHKVRLIGLGKPGEPAQFFAMITNQIEG